MNIGLQHAWTCTCSLARIETSDGESSNLPTQSSAVEIGYPKPYLCSCSLQRGRWAEHCPQVEWRRVIRLCADMVMASVLNVDSARTRERVSSDRKGIELALIRQKSRMRSGEWAIRSRIWLKRRLAAFPGISTTKTTGNLIMGHEICIQTDVPK